MRITNIQNTTNFQRKFTYDEKTEVNQLHSEIKKLLKTNGEKILILHDTSLPFNAKKDTGCGYLNSKEGQQFIDFAKTYLGITTIEVHPQGQYYIRPQNQFCCPYAGSGMSLGSHLINLELLTKSKYGKLLTSKQIAEVYKTNNAKDKLDYTNFENIIPEDSSFQKTLRKAFDKFNNLSETSKLKKEFRTYIAENNDWLDPQGVYTALRQEYKSSFEGWSELDKNLYNTDFNEAKRTKRINELKSKKSSEINFFKFKQFLAEKMLADGKANINQKGLKLYGDCLIGWGHQDIFTNPKAFLPNTSIGWGLPALNYDNILNESSDASKLLKRKVELFARRYDGIRFDVSWAYLSPCLYDKTTKKRTHKILETDAILKMIENTVKKVKGDKYNPSDLIHEFEASGEDFPLNEEHKGFIKKRSKVYSMQYMKYDWGHLAAYKESIGGTFWSYIIGLGNQDGVPQRNIATLKDIPFEELNEEKIIEILVDTFGGDAKTLKSKPHLKTQLIAKYNELLRHKEAQAHILAGKYGTTAEYLLNNPVEFSKYKATEAFNSPNTMLYFMDIFGSKKVFDAHSLNGSKNYRHRIPSNYTQEYINSAIEGFGINMFDIYEKLFIKNGLDKTQPELFKKIQKYKEILLTPKELPIYKQKTPLIISGVTLGVSILALVLKQIIATKKEATPKGRHFINKKI